MDTVFFVTLILASFLGVEMFSQRFVETTPLTSRKVMNTTFLHSLKQLFVQSLYWVDWSAYYGYDIINSVWDGGPMDGWATWQAIGASTFKGVIIFAVINFFLGYAFKLKLRSEKSVWLYGLLSAVALYLLFVGV